MFSSFIDLEVTIRGKVVPHDKLGEILDNILRQHNVVAIPDPVPLYAQQFYLNYIYKGLSRCSLVFLIKLPYLKTSFVLEEGPFQTYLA